MAIPSFDEYWMQQLMKDYKRKLAVELENNLLRSLVPRVENPCAEVPLPRWAVGDAVQAQDRARRVGEAPTMRYAGMDFSSGGDESVISIVDATKREVVEHFRLPEKFFRDLESIGPRERERTVTVRCGDGGSDIVTTGPSWGETVDKQLRFGEGYEIHPWNFRVGDYVRLKTGTSPQVVTHIVQRKIKGQPVIHLQTRYLSSMYTGHDYRGETRVAYAYMFLHRAGPDQPIPRVPATEDQTEKETEVTAKLYQTKDGKTFGTFLATNSEGKFVLELKGAAGEVKAFDPKDVEEVRPYTVKIVYMPSGVVAHFQAIKDSVKVGDVVLTKNGVLIRVSEVDTKKPPEGRLEGRKLVTEDLEEVQD